jgi:hypothetical protein
MKIDIYIPNEINFNLDFIELNILSLSLFSLYEFIFYLLTDLVYF